MKTIVNKFFVLIFCLFYVIDVFAKPTNPPEPPPGAGAKTSGIQAMNGLPPPVGLPMDENILILFVIAIVFGSYIIYKYQLKGKAPV